MEQFMSDMPTKMTWKNKQKIWLNTFYFIFKKILNVVTAKS